MAKKKSRKTLEINCILKVNRIYNRHWISILQDLRCAVCVSLPFMYAEIKVETFFISLSLVCVCVCVCGSISELIWLFNLACATPPIENNFLIKNFLINFRWNYWRKNTCNFLSPSILYFWTEKDFLEFLDGQKFNCRSLLEHSKKKHFSVTHSQREITFN